MRGVRGGLKDQIKAFREFLIRRKKKKIKEYEMQKLKKKKDVQEKRKRQVYISQIEIVLNDIENKIINEDKINLGKTKYQLDNISKKRYNFSILNKIEEVKQKVETEILFEEIVKQKVTNLNAKDNKKIEKFISLSSQFINKSNDEKEINHYFNMVGQIHKKHTNEKNILVSNKLDNYIIKEEQVMLLAKQQKDNVKKQKKEKVLFWQDTKEQNKTNDKIEKVKENIPEEIVEVQLIDNKEKNDIKLVNNHEKIDVQSISDDEKVDIEYQDTKGISQEKNEEKIEEKTLENETGKVLEYVSSDEKFDTKEFDIINENVKQQVIYNEKEIEKIKKQIKNINNLFEEKSGFDKFLDFSSNLINLGRGLINKHLFSNNLVKRLNSEILINNSLKGIHRVFTDEKKEVPYIVFKSFMSDINDKKDCAIKINDICEDSLTEIRKLKSDFITKYGNINDSRVDEFINRFDSIEKDLIKRQENAKKIEKQAIEQYQKNYQKVKVRK